MKIISIVLLVLIIYNILDMQSIKYISSLNLLELYAPMLNVVKQFHPYIYSHMIGEEMFEST